MKCEWDLKESGILAFQAVKVSGQWTAYLLVEPVVERHTEAVGAILGGSVRLTPETHSHQDVIET